MKRAMMLIAALTLMTALYVPQTSAQTDQAAAAQDPKQAENDLYKAWYEARQAKDYTKALSLTKEYLEKFPSGQYVVHMKKFQSDMRGMRFNEAIKAKNMDEMLRTGREALGEDANNLDYIFQIALQLRENEFPNFAHAREAGEFNQKAIALIEGGKMPTGVDVAKKDVILAALYQNLAVVEAKGQNVDKALEYYKKSSALNPAEQTLNAFNYLACGSLHNEKYNAAVQKYQAMPEADRAADPPKPEVKAALDEANAQADMVIECWARFMASSASASYGETRTKIESALTALYKYRHPDSPDGLKKLIDQYRSGATAAPSQTSSSTKL